MEGALMPPPSVFGAHAESQRVPVSNLEHLLGVSQPDQAPMLQSGFSSALAPGQSGTSDAQGAASGDRAACQLDGAGEASIGSVSRLRERWGCQDGLAYTATCAAWRLPYDATQTETSSLGCAFVRGAALVGY